LNVNDFHRSDGDNSGLIEDKKLINDFIMEIKEFRYISWDEKLEMVKTYIDENNCRPSKHSNDKNIKSLGQWISHQIKNSKERKYIMSDDTIYKKWNEFINDPLYKEYFLSNEEEWYDSLNMVKTYISENNKRPSTHSNDKNIKQLGQWISDQIKNSKERKKIMKNDSIYNKWNEFINEPLYKEYFNK